MVLLFLLRFALAALLIAAATLAQRRWGAEAGGRLLGLPMLSVPVLVLLDLQHGPGFAELAARGTLAGTAAAAAFAAGYAHTHARRPGWALVAGCACFAAATVALDAVHIGLALLAALVAASVVVALRTWPADVAGPAKAAASAQDEVAATPPWEVALRMLVAGLASYGLTASAGLLGPHVAGLLSPFPILTTILALFARHRGGGRTSVSVVRGMLTGLVGFTGCFAAICAVLPRAGLTETLLVGISLALLGQTRPVLRAVGAVHG